FSLHAAPPPELYPLSLHDALPISDSFFDLRQVLGVCFHHGHVGEVLRLAVLLAAIEVELIAPKDGTLHHRLGQVHARRAWKGKRSEEHTSELQSRFDLVCRLLLEK